MRGFALGLCLLAVQLWAQQAQAESPCALPAGASAALGEREPAARLNFIRQSLREVVRQETFYLGGWSLIYGGIAAGTWIFVPLSDDVSGQMKESAWNTATALGAAVLMMIEPLRVRSDQQKLERLLARSEHQSDSCALLKEAERLFRHVADSETNSRGALMHLGNFAVNVGLGLVLGYGLKRPDSAGMNTMIGTVLGELMIVTRPTLAARRLASYRSGELSSASQKEPLFNLVPAPIPGGITLALTGAF